MPPQGRIRQENPRQNDGAPSFAAKMDHEQQPQGAVPLFTPEKGRIHMIDRDDQVKDAVAKICASPKLGLDMETRPQFQKGAAPFRPSLLQVAIPSGDIYLFSLPQLRNIQLLGEFINSSSHVKCGCGVIEDIVQLQAAYPSYFSQAKGFVDATFIAQKMLRHDRGNLFYLAETFCGVSSTWKSKKVQLSNWNARPLTDRQMQYAADDAWASLLVLDGLAKILPVERMVDKHLLNPEQLWRFLNEDKLHRVGKELHIFDFDGTIFRSPVPNAERLGPERKKECMVPPWAGGLGWFQDATTLDPPFVPRRPVVTMDKKDGKEEMDAACSGPDPAWYNLAVVQEFRKAVESEQAFIVVLTGRDKSFRSRIEELLLCAGLVPDDLMLKHNPQMNTEKYKFGMFDMLVDRVKPQKIVLHEDRPHHGEQFRDYLLTKKLIQNRIKAKGCSPFEIVDLRMVSEEDSNHFLPDKIEESLLSVLRANREKEQEAQGRKGKR